MSVTQQLMAVISCVLTQLAPISVTVILDIDSTLLMREYAMVFM